MIAAAARLGKSVTELKSAMPQVLNTPEMRFQVDESRKFAAIEEVVGTRDGGFETQPIFVYKGPGDDAGFAATGAVPRFYADLESRGISADQSVFK